MYMYTTVHVWPHHDSVFIHWVTFILYLGLHDHWYMAGRRQGSCGSLILYIHVHMYMYMYMYLLKDTSTLAVTTITTVVTQGRAHGALNTCMWSLRTLEYVVDHLGLVT